MKKDAKMDTSKAEAFVVVPQTGTDGETSLVSFALPKKGDRRRLESMNVRVQPEDKAALQALARKADLSLSAYCGLILHNIVRQASGHAE